MDRFLRALVPSLPLRRLSLIIALLLVIGQKQANGQATADLAISDLTLTAVDQTNFIYSFTLVNNGTTAVTSYSMKLTFSNSEIDQPEFFVLTIPASEVGGQYIGPGQTLIKNEHFYASAPNFYLPSGTWYVVAEINYDHVTEETDFTNNVVVSSNTIEVPPYQIEFIQFPTIEDVTDNSFKIRTQFDNRILYVYYRYQADGTPAPDQSTLQASPVIFPEQTDLTTVLGLGPAYSYDVYFIGESYDGNFTAVYKVDVTTLGSSVPTIVTDVNHLEFSATPIGRNSESGVINIKAFHLTADVTVTPTAEFLVSTDNITYLNSVTFQQADFLQAASAIVYVRSAAINVAGLSSGMLTFTTAGASNKEVGLTISIFNALAGSFDGLTSLSESGWTAYNASGDHVWELIDLDETSVNQRSQGDKMAVQIDGSTGAAAPNEDWLISPQVDVSGFVLNPTLRFRSYSSGLGEPLVLKYSADYPGSGDPRNATWFDTGVEFPLVNSAQWKNSMVELLNREENLHFAFVYRSTAEAGSRWTIDDWRITDNLVNIPEDILTFDNIEVGTSSEAQSITIEIVGFGDVTITVSDGFQVSLDNVTFSPSVVVAEDDISTGQTLYVRFSPKTVSAQNDGTLTFTATDFSVTRNTLVGSSTITTALEKDLRSTGFIYPNPTDGIVHVDLQAFENSETSMPVFVANSIGDMIATFEVPVTALDTKLSEVVCQLAPGIYYVTVQGRGAVYRNKLVRK